MSQLLQRLGLAPFSERFPWIGADLQTLRNSLRPIKSEPETGQSLEFALPAGDRLLARLDLPQFGEPPHGLVVVVHGLGGCGDDGGQRRLGRALSLLGFGVVRLNLRGAGPGRLLAKGTYAANCSRDLLPVLKDCRQLAHELALSGERIPLGAVGLSLGGTVLLNALLDGEDLDPPVLDGLVCISSPLDLHRCADQMERPRNTLYRRWLVRRLIQQTLADPFGLPDGERLGLQGYRRPQTIRAFDDGITAPRWGFKDVGAYYHACSPMPRLRQALDQLPPLLLVHAKDDPWVPALPLMALAPHLSDRHALMVTDRGGHNGFHAPGDSEQGCWSDRLAALWLQQVLLPWAAN